MAIKAVIERLFDGQAVEVQDHWFLGSYTVTLLDLENQDASDVVSFERRPANKNGSFIVEKETGTIVGVEVVNTRQVLLDAVGAAIRPSY